MRNVDVAIMGAGDAGRAAAEAVRQSGQSWVLIDQGPSHAPCPGLTCLSSRALIEFAHRLNPGRYADDGFLIGEPAWTEQGRDLRSVLVEHGISNGADISQDDENCLRGQARFRAPDLLEVDGEGVQAKRIIVATGSRARVPDGWDAFGPRLLTPDSLFEPQDLPGSVAVVGLDAAGLELALALHRLGVRVTGFDSRHSIAGIGDPEVNGLAIEEVGRQMRIYPGRRVQVHGSGKGVVVSAGAATVTADRLLVSAGRTPNLPEGLLDLCPLDRNGRPAVDRGTLQLGDLPVFVAGGSTVQRMTPQEAAEQGRLAGLNATRETPLSHPPKVPVQLVFAAPNIAQVGARLSQVPDCVVGRRRFGPVACGLIMGRNRGLIRLYAERRTGRLLGAAMIGPRVGHLAHRIAWSIGQGHTVQRMLSLPCATSVIEEGLRDALTQAFRRLRACGGLRSEAA